MIKIAICDDEETVRQEISEQIELFADKNRQSVCIRFYASGEALIQDYEQDTDLIFLDIVMEGIDGIETAQKLRGMDEKVLIVFITSMGARMREGYKVSASDFIVKPLHHDIFRAELKELFLKLQHHKEKYLETKNDSGFYKMNLHDIIYITIEKGARNVTIVTQNEEITDYRSLWEIEKELSGKGFFRCHKSFIVNMEAIQKLVGFTVFFKHNDLSIPVSKERKKALKEQMMIYLGVNL